CGLLHYAGTQKPAWQALQSFDTQGDTLTDACGNFSGPKLTLVAPKPNLRYRGPLLINVSASSSYGVPRITIYSDGKKIRNFTSRAHPALLTGRINWKIGRAHV